MKILLVLTKADLGGAQKRVAELARAYTEARQNVAVAYGEGGPLEEVLDNAGVQKYQLRSLRRSRNPLKILALIFELRRLVRADKFDIVHLNSANTLAGALGVRFSGVGAKSVYTFRGLSVLDPSAPVGGLARFIYKMYFKLFLAFVDARVFQCQANVDEAHKMGLAGEGKVIAPGIDPDALEFLPKDEAREELGRITGISLEQKTILGSVGRLADQKNYAFLIDLFPDVLEQNPEAALVILGDGPNRAELGEKIARLGLSEHVFLLGGQSEAHRFLKGFDIFVLASYYEGISVALTEAVFADLPLVVSNVGGNPEFVDKKHAQAFTLDDKEDFLKKLASVMGAEGTSEENGDERVAPQANFHLECSASAYLELYKKIT